MTWWHRAGQRVVCVKPATARWDDQDVIPHCPRTNAAYTVREVVAFGSGIGFRLEEIRNPSFDCDDGSNEEPAFATHAFRPVTDISSLERIAREVTAHERVDA